MPASFKSLTVAAAACALFAALPAQAATDCAPLRGCAAKFCHIENDIAAAQAQNNTRREAGLRKALSEAKASCTDSRLQSQRDVREKQSKVTEREQELKEAKAKGKQDKIDKAQRKLEEAQAEYNDALADLNR